MTTNPITTTTESIAVDTVDVVDSVDAYVATWNEADPDARRALIESALAADLWYRDPLLEADGLDAYDAMIAAVQARFPGMVMRRTSDVDAHRDLVRFTWALGPPEGEAVVTGVDVAKFDGEGRLHRIIGFTPERIPGT